MKRFIPFILFCLLLSCSAHKEKGISLEQALSMAGENRKELEKVLEYYKDDSLKLKAAQYLIVNMPFHFSRTEYFLSPDNQRYVPDIARFSDSQAVENHCDSLSANGYAIQKEIVYDSKTLSSYYLIRNIDLAFRAWQKPWAKDVAFDDFCRYILPYRSQMEPISDMRQILMERYLQILDTNQVKNAFDACMLINAQFMTDLKYKKTGNPLYPTIEETYHAKTGECEALCNLAIFVMRAAGIPVVVQNTTWTRMDLGHSWGAVWQDGKFYDFSPAFVQPDTYRKRLTTTRFLKPAKVYRFLFEPDLKKEKTEDDGFITFLKSPLLRDVTIEGECPTFDLQLVADKAVSSTQKQIYLCTYNNGQWEPLAIGALRDSICEFKNVAGNNIFIVAEAIDKYNLHYITVPFLAKADGSVHKFIPNIHELEQTILPQQKYSSATELHYWDISNNQFRFINCDSIHVNSQLYTQIPENSLLMFKTTPQSTGKLGFIQGDTLINIREF